MTTTNQVENVIGVSLETGNYDTVKCLGVRGETKTISKEGEEMATRKFPWTEMTMSYMRRSLNREVEDLNKETGILSIGVLGSYCPKHEPVPEFIVSVGNIAIKSHELVSKNDKLFIKLSVSYKATYRKWHDESYKEVFDREFEVELDSVATDGLKDKPTTIEDFLVGYRTDRTFSDTVYRAVKAEEKKLHNEMLSKGE